FTLPASEAGKKVVLTLKAISHSADLYVNGQKLTNKYNNITDHSFLQNGPPIQANYSNLTSNGHGTTSKYANGELSRFENDFFGTFRRFDVDITDYLTTDGTPNNIKLKVTRASSASNDLTYHWVDWHPRPVDGMMGLTAEASISTSGLVRLDNPAVSAKVAEDLSTATLSLYCDATSLADVAVAGTATAVVKDPSGAVVATASKSVTIPARKYNQEIAFRAADFPSLVLTNPKLWWPYMSGDQPLYTVDWSFAIEGAVSDALTHRAGIREINVDLNVTPLGNQNRATVTGSSGANMIQFYVNHKPVILDGGGYCPTDLFLRHDPVANQGVIDNMKYAGLNFFRDEGKFFDNDLLDLCDENGILVMTGWCCCDLNQSPNGWSHAERFNAYEGQYAQIKNLRQHASGLLWFNGSDEPPSNSNNANTRMVEEQYIRVEAMSRWDEIGITAASACLDVSNLLGGINTGFHMDSSYDNQSPSHMFNPGSVGSSGVGPFGFIGEGLGGAGIPPIESMKKFIPEANLFPYNSTTNTNYSAWNLHATTSGFTTFGPLIGISDNAYGESTTLESYHAKISAAQFDQYRAQSEALNYHRYKNTTGRVNWMMNNARPGMYWQQFDFYMNPTTATFGAAKANEPVHIMYNIYDHDISVINRTYNDYGNMTATAEIYNIDGELVSETLEKTIHVVPDSVGPTTAYGTMTRTPKRNASHYNEADGTFTDVAYTYNGQILDAYGVNILWNYADIEKSLVKATSDVYFVRLQLKDSSGEVVSYNSYAIPMRSDIATTTSWNRGTPVSAGDYSALNSLPALTAEELTCVQTGSKTVDGIVTQTLRITNNSDTIAHNVYLAAYPNNKLEDLIGAVQYTDNMFILFPGETRIIDVTHRTSNLAGDAFITATCYNNQVGGDKPVRFKNVYTGNGLGQGKSLSVNRPVTLSAGSNGGNITTISSGNITMANAHKTFIDCATNSNATLTLSSNSAWFYVDLGATKAFDKVMLRANNGTALRGRPDTVVIAGSDSTSGPWTNLATYNNTGGSIMMDIVLPETANYRYVRATCTSGTGSLLISGFDVYAFNNYVDVNIYGDGVVTSGGKTIGKDTLANQKVLAVEPDGSVELTFTPDAFSAMVRVLANGVDISSQLVDKGDLKALTLSGLAGDVDLDVYFGIQAFLTADNVTYVNDDVVYTLSLMNAKDVLAVEAEFLIDGNMLAGKGLVGLNGFDSMNGVLWLYVGDNLWKGEVTLALPSGNSTGLTTDAPVDIAKFLYTAKGYGNAAMTLTSARVVFLDGTTKYLGSKIENGTATTIIARSKYDLNRDGVVDALDLGIMLLYCGFDADSPSWTALVKVNDAWGNPVTASMCDVNADGMIDMLDLLDLFIHYTK
ncbi:MAG: discoidin domain-containing protein, partial [Clostridiales bacterium]|nr:discoidin domain-containing protein [Clostridiales bacterium]